jgi:hypothetical protein
MYGQRVLLLFNVLAVLLLPLTVQSGQITAI